MAAKKGDEEPEEKDEKTVLIRMRVSKLLHSYLSILAKRTLLGGSENDVAEHVLTRRLETMLQEKYHETHAVPRDTD